MRVGGFRKERRNSLGGRDVSTFLRHVMADENATEPPPFEAVAGPARCRWEKERGRRNGHPKTGRVRLGKRSTRRDGRTNGAPGKPTVRTRTVQEDRVHEGCLLARRLRNHLRPVAPFPTSERDERAVRRDGTPTPPGPNTWFARPFPPLPPFTSTASGRPSAARIARVPRAARRDGCLASDPRGRS
eukprot:scaffold155_cov347-Pavlova_lutheri.AAC.65